MKNIIGLLVGLFASASAFALPPDFSTITGAVDFSTVVTGVLAVAVAVVGVYLAARGARMLLAFVRK